MIREGCVVSPFRARRPLRVLCARNFVLGLGNRAVCRRTQIRVRLSMREAAGIGVEAERPGMALPQARRQSRHLGAR